MALCREPTGAGAETKSFCPCQKSQVSLLRYLTFSLVCGRIWQRGAPAGPPAVRVVGRWSPVATVQRRPRRQPRQVRPVISAMLWWRPPPPPDPFPGFLTRLHPSPTAAPLSSTQNAPGFAFFWLNRVRFLFLAVFRAQNFWTGFCASCRLKILCLKFLNSMCYNLLRSRARIMVQREITAISRCFFTPFGQIL